MYNVDNSIAHTGKVLDGFALALLGQNEYTACKCTYLNSLQIKNSLYNADTYLNILETHLNATSQSVTSKYIMWLSLVQIIKNQYTISNKIIE